MTINILVACLALLASVQADPAWFIRGSPFYTAPYTSALVASGAAPGVVAPVSPVASLGPIAPVAPLAPGAPVPTVGPTVAALPYTSVSQYNYAYGSSLSYSDYLPVVNSAYSLPYTVPYAYAASRDWYYRK